MERFANAAMQYCKWRITAGSALTLCCAVLLGVAAVVVRNRSADTGKYVKTTGTVVGGAVVSRWIQSDKRTVYEARYKVRYVVGGAAHHATASSSSYGTEGEAQRDLQAAVAAGARKTLYYDPADPRKNTLVRNIEDKTMVIMLAIACAMAVGAVLSYVFRNNPLMCGYRIARNANYLF